MGAKDKLEQGEATYQAGKKAGRREVVEHVNQNYWVDDYGKGYFNVDNEWQAKLKKWGINEKT